MTLSRPGKCPACGGVGRQVARSKWGLYTTVPCFVYKLGIIWVRFAP